MLDKKAMLDKPLYKAPHISPHYKALYMRPLYEVLMLDTHSMLDIGPHAKPHYEPMLDNMLMLDIRPPMQCLTKAMLDTFLILDKRIVLDKTVLDKMRKPGLCGLEAQKTKFFCTPLIFFRF